MAQSASVNILEVLELIFNDESENVSLHPDIELNQRIIYCLKFAIMTYFSCKSYEKAELRLQNTSPLDVIKFRASSDLVLRANCHTIDLLMATSRSVSEIQEYIGLNQEYFCDYGHKVVPVATLNPRAGLAKSSF